MQNHIVELGKLSGSIFKYKEFQAEEFDVMIRVVEPVVVRAIRLEVPASNYPQVKLRANILI